VRLGNGTLVNEYVSNEGTHEIKNSFVDSSASGLIKKLNTNSSQENEVAISNCYFTNGDEVIIEKVGNTFEVLTNVIKATNKADFAEWSYSKSYSSMVDWCDYDYLAGSKKLDFVYPLQSGFVKVFLTGSCYESVMVAGDTVVDATNLKMAFSEADKNQEAEVNLLVEKIFMEARAQVQNNTNIKVNALKDTTIIRGENNEDSLFVAAGGAKITIGEDAEEVGVAGGRSTSPTITIDGNRDYIEKNKLESGAVVVSYGAEVELKENVVIKNNINNNVKYGGAVLLFNTAAKSTIDATFENCYAENGGGAVCVVGTTVNSLGSAYNCSTKGKGGVAYFTNELPQSSTQAMRTLYGKGLNVQPIEDPEAGELEDGFNISTSSYYYSYGSMDADGGVFYCEGTLTISGAPHFDGGGCANGGAIYATNLIITGNPIFEANNVDTKGGAIYVAEDLIISGSPLFDGNSSNGDGGAIYAGGDVTISGSPKFTSNSSGDRGGAVAADNTTFASTSSAEFNENFADLGGAIYSYNDIEISGNPIFDENGAAKSGSAIDCEGTLTISGNPTFSNHGDYNLGTCGAINVWSSVEISGNPTFIGNRGDYYTDNHAAAIYSDGVVNITGNPLFSGNFSVYNGVIYAAGDVTVSGAPSFIENNTNGIGAIKSDSKITISGDADFYANSAGDWGVISAPTVIISGNPNFVDNPSNAPCNMGGGISASTLVEISGSPTFINCYTDDGQGGAIYSEGDVVISGNPTFAGNKLGTYDGGAIYAYNNVIVSGSP
ncbi:MAG: hypothetical protein IKY10_00875, partial [Clostridia bacterium]|nr:hypothetical protein [Clostridia bacterium]